MHNRIKPRPFASVERSLADYRPLSTAEARQERAALQPVTRVLLGVSPMLLLLGCLIAFRTGPFAYLEWGVAKLLGILAILAGLIALMRMMVRQEVASEYLDATDETLGHLTPMLAANPELLAVAQKWAAERPLQRRDVIRLEYVFVDWQASLGRTAFDDLIRTASNRSPTLAAPHP